MMRKEATILIESIVSLIYYMRGAVTYSEAMNMTYAERRIFEQFLEQRFEQESKRLHPIY